MEATMNTSDTTSVRKEFLALLERGRQIKARRQKEAEAWLAERRRRQEEAERTGYYKLFMATPTAEAEKAFITETITRGFKEAKEGRFAGKNLTSLDALIDEIRAEA